MSKQKAFTLVELLVVIGIIAVLISILLPALSRVRYQAQVTACAARMRDMTGAVIMYANENKGALPPFKGDEGQPTFGINRGDLFQFRDIYQLGETSTSMGRGYNLGRLYTTGYLKTFKTTWCPSAFEKPDLQDNNTRSYFNYALNPHLSYRSSTELAARQARLWWKKLPNFGRGSAGVKQVQNFAGTEATMTIPQFRRAILIDPLYGNTNDFAQMTHALGTSRAFNLGYPDGSVTSYRVAKFSQRPASSWREFLDLSNAFQHAADGGAISWSSTSTWNGVYGAIPIIPQ